MSELLFHWLTRPRADSEETAKMLTPAGIHTIISPVMHIALHEALLPTTTWHGIILTSRHSAPCLGQSGIPRTTPVFCAGSATAAAAANCGFSSIITGEGDALSLLPPILAHTAEGDTLLYLSGEDIRIDLAALLHAQRRTVETLHTYKAEPETALSNSLLEALAHKTVSSVSFYSARSATLAGTLLAAHGLQASTAEMDACCLSLPVAEAAASGGFRSIKVAASPTAAALRDLIISTHGKTML